MKRLVITMVSLLGATLVAAGLQIAPPQQPTETISGTVTRADTKAPLPHTRLELVREDYARLPTGQEKPCNPEPDSESFDSRRFVTTDASGKFTFSGINPGSYYLFAEREGFLKFAYGQLGVFPVPKVLRIGLPLPLDQVFATRNGPSELGGSERSLATFNTAAPARGGLGRDQQGARGGAATTGLGGGLGRDASRLPADAGAAAAFGDGGIENERNQLRNIQIAMTPAPTITGSVIDDRGVPLAGASVQAYQFRFTPMNGRTLKSIRAALTNDEGKFRLFWLNAGRYVVAAGYTDYGLQPWTQGLNLTANLPNPDSGYAMMFYPTTATAANALVVPLNPGAEPIVDFRLRPRPRVIVRIRLTGQRPANATLVFASYGGDLCAAPDYGITRKSDGTFEIRDVPEGVYVAAAISGRDFISDLAMVKVETGGTNEATLPVVPAVEIRGNVYFDGVPATVGRGQARINLTRQGQALRQVATAVINSANGRFSIPGLGPGAYFPTVDLPPGFYVDSVLASQLAASGDCNPDVAAAARYNYMDAHGHLDPQLPLRIPSVIPEASDCLVIKVKYGGPLIGFVYDRLDKPVSGALVVAVPKSAWGKAEDGAVTPPDRFLLTTTDSTGRFLLQGTTPWIAPSRTKDVSGSVPQEYHLYAFESIDPNEIYDPRFVERFRSHEGFELRHDVYGAIGWRTIKIETPMSTMPPLLICESETSSNRDRCFLTAIPASETAEIQ